MSKEPETFKCLPKEKKLSLTKEQILSSETPLKIAEVVVPELGGSVHVRELSGHERDAYDQVLFEHKDDFRGVRAALCAMTLCDETGRSLGFTDAEADELGGKSGAAIDRIYEKAKDLSGLNDNAVEESEKNLPPGPNESSG